MASFLKRRKRGLNEGRIWRTLGDLLRIVFSLLDQTDISADWWCSPKVLLMVRVEFWRGIVWQKRKP